MGAAEWLYYAGENELTSEEGEFLQGHTRSQDIAMLEQLSWQRAHERVREIERERESKQGPCQAPIFFFL